MADERLSPELIEAIGRLKEVPRTGWLDRGIPADETESVADHSFGVALLAWLLIPDELDRAPCRGGTDRIAQEHRPRLARPGDETERGERGDGLPRPRLADEREDRTGDEVEGDLPGDLARAERHRVVPVTERGDRFAHRLSPSGRP